MQIFGFDRYGGPDVTTLREVPEPETGSSPEPHGVLIRMAAAGVNPADIKVRSGERRDTVEVRFPMAVGREAAGVVVTDPTGTYAPDDRVFGAPVAGTGALAELVLLDPAQATPIPDGVGVDAAACIPVAIGTAWDALHELGVGPGDRVLVLGAGGGVGVHAVQLARHLGATVIGVASAGKQQLVTSFGATHVLSGERWSDRVAVVAGDEVDAVVDTVGGTTLREAAALLRPAGPDAASGRVRLRSVADVPGARTLGGDGVTRRRDRAVYAELAALIADGTLRPVIGAIFPLADAADAVALVEGGHAAGKVVVTA